MLTSERSQTNKMPANKKRFNRSKESLKSDSDRSKNSSGSKAASEKSKRSDLSRESADKSMDSDNNPNASADIDAGPVRTPLNVEVSGKLNLKIVLLGDWQVGKSSLIVHYTTGHFDRNDNLIGENCTNDKEMVINGKTVTITFQDTGYSQTPHVWSDMRDSFGADLFLICYSINNKESFDNVTAKWLPAVDANFPQAPRMLVGCKKDLRDTVYSNRKLANIEQAKQSAAKYGMEYKEISLMDSESVHVCMERAIELALRSVKKDKKDTKCVVS